MYSTSRMKANLEVVVGLELDPWRVLDDDEVILLIVEYIR